MDVRQELKLARFTDYARRPSRWQRVCRFLRRTFYQIAQAVTGRRQQPLQVLHTPLFVEQRLREVTGVRRHECER